MLTRRKLVGAEIETTYGTAVAVGTEDIVLAWDIAPAFAIEPVDRPIIRPILSALAPVPGARTAAIDFSCEIASRGPTTPPRIEKFLRACGFSVYSDSSVRLYEPVDSSLDSATVTEWQDGLKHVIKGARGTVTFSFEMNNIARATFHFEGLDFTYEEEALPTGYTYESEAPPIVLGNTVNIDDYNPVLPSIELELGNEIVRPPSLKSASGYDRVEVTARNAAGTIAPEPISTDLDFFYQKWSSGSKAWLCLILGTEFRLYIPRLHIREWSPEDRDGIYAESLPFRAAGLIGSVDGTADGGGTTTTVISTATFTTNDEYNGCRLTFKSNTATTALQGVARIITDVDAATNTATVWPALPSAPASLSPYDTFTISDKEIQLAFY